MKLWKFLAIEWRRYVIGIILLTLVALVNLVPPQIIGKVIDLIQREQLTSSNLWMLIGILVGAGILTYVFRYFWRVFIFGASQSLGRRLRKTLYEKYTSMSPEFFQQHRTGDLMAHATNDIRAVQNAGGGGVLTIADSLIMGGSVVVTMAATVSWKLTLLVLIPLPLLIVATNYLGRLLNRAFKKSQAAFSNLNDKTQESIAGIKVNKTFGYEREDRRSFKKLTDETVDTYLRVTKVDALFDPTIILIIGTSYLIGIVFGSRMVIHDEITLGQLITFTTYLSMMVWPLLALGLFFNIYQRGRASYDRILKIMDEPNGIDVSASVTQAPCGDIVYQIASFTFPDEATSTLSDVHFSIPEGSTVGIVGRTGAGKSSLVRLLIREFDTQRPEDIMYGDQPIRNYTLEQLRGQFGYVPQEHFLFSTTIKENIAFSDPTMSDETIYHAAEVSNIHEDILQFTEGYDTVVGERGVSLSGGQKQRVSIARAMVTDPAVLILDDALSAVDAETESKILMNMKNERQGKTNIIIAHRMSAVSHADHIVVMDNGTVVEQGTHDTLMAKRGWYFETYRAQTMKEHAAHRLEAMTQREEGDDNGR